MTNRVVSQVGDFVHREIEIQIAPPGRMAMCSDLDATETNRAVAPRSAGCKRPLAVLAVDDAAAAAEGRAKRTAPANLSADAGAMVLYEAPALPLQQVEPTDDVPPQPAALPIQVPLAAVVAPREAPDWISRFLLPQLKLRVDLTVTFIGAKALAKSDIHAQQNRFRLPTDGVLRRLLPILTDEEVEAANLLSDQPITQSARSVKSDIAAVDGEEQGKTRNKKKLGRKHDGLPVLVVAGNLTVKPLKLLRWDSAQVMIIRGDGYHHFIDQCGFEEDDVVEIWAFRQNVFHFFGVDMCNKSPIYIVLDKKHGDHSGGSQ